MGLFKFWSNIHPYIRAAIFVQIVALNFSIGGILTDYTPMPSVGFFLLVHATAALAGWFGIYQLYNMAVIESIAAGMGISNEVFVNIGEVHRRIHKLTFNYKLEVTWGNINYISETILFKGYPHLFKYPNGKNVATMVVIVSAINCNFKSYLPEEAKQFIKDNKELYYLISWHCS